jgi:hypothetical protein
MRLHQVEESEPGEAFISPDRIARRTDGGIWL